MPGDDAMPFTVTEAEAAHQTTLAIAGALKILKDAKARVSTLRTVAKANPTIEDCNSILFEGVVELEELRDTLSFRLTQS